MDFIPQFLYLLVLKNNVATTAIGLVPHLRSSVIKGVTGDYRTEGWDSKLIDFIKKYNSILRRANNDATEVENRRHS